MPRIAASALRTNLSDTVNRVAYRGERLVLERRGKPVAVLIPIEDLALLEAIEDRQDYEEAVRALRDARKRRERPIPLADVKKLLKLG